MGLLLFLLLVQLTSSPADPLTSFTQGSARQSTRTSAVRVIPLVGAERIFEEPYLSWIKGKRVGLISNPTGVNSRLEATVDLFAKRPDLQLVALFGPEHGFQGHAQAGQVITTDRNVYTLYGETRAPTDEMLRDVDVLVYDIQDVGVRFYTYISTMFESMKSAAKKGISFVVLDRPNPISGTRVEGPVLEPGFESFVGVFPLPIRYGMTAGELARFFNVEAKIGCDLKVVPMSGWARTTWYDQMGLEWVMPSPNMPALTTAIVYPGFTLIEGTNLSEGRGTTRPFELAGAPWLNNQELAQRLNALHLPGVHFRPQAFTPTFSKYKEAPCFGLQIHVLDRERFDPILTALHFLTETRKLHSDQLEFNEKHFNRLAGNRWIREALLKGQPVNEMTKRWQPALNRFKKTREKYLLYP